MAYTNIDTDVMRSSAKTFVDCSVSFSDESSNIKNTLTDISSALDNVVKSFNIHNENVDGYASSLSSATQSMESVWESGAATAFQNNFDAFNKAMENLSTSLAKISESFSTIKSEIEEIVNGDILKQTEDYAEKCSVDGENLTKYANAEDENQERLASAYGS